jgi:ribonucleoside-diphosphate reductase alpha chain
LLKLINLKEKRKIMTEYGPTLPISVETHIRKYRQDGETFRESQSRVANTLADDPKHFYEFREILLNQRFLPAGRVQASIGSPRQTTAMNCFVSRTIEDSMDGIMKAAAEAAQTMRLGGGIGYDFSTIRPRGDIIVSLDSKSSGVLSFMQIFDSVCKTVASAGQRRGAQMGVLRVDHPDIEEFIEAKTNATNLTQFNVSVGVTDDFMRAVEKGKDFELSFEGRTYKRVDARYLWDKIMRATWDWAEPGVLYIDRINEMNNLQYCEVIAATNPCGEQPLPPYGACLLGSFNMVKYLKEETFDWEGFEDDIPVVVRAMDNIYERTNFPLKEQEREAKDKRRMGLGVTGMANAGEGLGYEYGSNKYLKWQDRVLRTLANDSYKASALIAKDKGSFPLYTEEFLDSKFVKRLRPDVQDLIKINGIRNSHLTSIAPTGTISLSADNISSGIEPVFSHAYDRTIINDEGGADVTTITDYGYRELNVKGKTADECTADEHLNVLIHATKWVDSAVSKTLNVGDIVTWDEFKDIYVKAWKGGCKGCTTFRAAGERYGILNKVDTEPEAEEGGACYIDLKTGKKQCE